MIMDDQNRNMPPRRDPKNFEVHIPEEELSTGARRPPYSPKYVETRDSINSFSDSRSRDTTAQKKEVEKKEARAHQRRNKEKRKKNRRIFKLVWVVMVIFTGLALAQYLLAGIDDMLAVNKSKITVTVEIPKDATTDEVAQILYDNGVIEKTDFFKLYSKFTKADGFYRNGTYELSTDMDYEAIINHLQSNVYRVDTVKVTFPEGLNVMEVAQLMEENGVCSEEEVLEAANSDEFDGFDLIDAVDNETERYYKVEGYLFPDTYEFYKSEDPVDALSKLIRNCDRKLDEDLLAQIEETGMTVDEIMTIASIIQEESADEEDMYIVSSILHNRLRDGAENGTAQLGCDSTVYYPYRTQSEVPESERETFKSRYNTYEIIGLPPGSICNPSLKAIEAAISPSDTDYYYFCHDKDGNAYYAKTAQQHQQNLKKAGLAE